MKVRVKTTIHPSEDPQKVKKAVLNIFPSIELELEESKVSGKSNRLDSLENLKNKLGLQAIRDSARRELRKRQKENSIRFFLNKQVAKVSKVNFSDGNTPLDPIEISIEAKDIEKILNYLAPTQKEREK